MASTIKTQGLSVIRSTIEENVIDKNSHHADLLKQTNCKALSLCGMSWNKATKFNNDNSNNQKNARMESFHFCEAASQCHGQMYDSPL
mmetsp:Transcript_35668/g.41297  ORF Transcript_35668/g.41297 Transcript_35668/m.41297 type:complete len:88 (+) Transcript_35668:1006-1269(+)